MLPASGGEAGQTVRLCLPSSLLHLQGESNSTRPAFILQEKTNMFSQSCDISLVGVPFNAESDCEMYCGECFKK